MVTSLHLQLLKVGFDASNYLRTMVVQAKMTDTGRYREYFIRMTHKFCLYLVMITETLVTSY